MASDTNSTVEDIADVIETAGHGTVGTDIFIDFEPPSKPTTVTTIVYESGGFDPEATKGRTLDHPTIKVLIIGPVDDPASAIAQAQKIKELLHLIDPFTTAGGVGYSGIYQQGGRNSIGNDKNRRPQYTLNFRVNRKYD